MCVLSLITSAQKTSLRLHPKLFLNASHVTRITSAKISAIFFRFSFWALFDTQLTKIVELSSYIDFEKLTTDCPLNASGDGHVMVTIQRLFCSSTDVSTSLLFLAIFGFFLFLSTFSIVK